MAEFQKYMTQFTYGEVQAIIAMFKLIEKEGYAHVRSMCTKL